MRSSPSPFEQKSVATVDAQKRNHADENGNKNETPPTGLTSNANSAPRSLPFKLISSLSDNKGEKLSLPIPRFSNSNGNRAALATLAQKTLYFSQPEILCVKESTFLAISDLNALSLICRYANALFQPAVTAIGVQRALDTVSHDQRTAVEKMMNTNHTLSLFRHSGVTQNSSGQKLAGSPLGVAIRENARSFVRDDYIPNAKCDLFFQSIKPTQYNLLAEDFKQGSRFRRPGPFRAYVFVYERGKEKEKKGKKLTEFYFVELTNPYKELSIRQVPFLENKSPFTLAHELFHGLDYQDLLGLTPQQLAIITRHTGDTYEEGVEDMMKRHIRAEPDGEAWIAAEQARQLIPGWEVEEEARIADRLKALDDLMSVVKKVSDRDCADAYAIDDAIVYTLYGKTEAQHDNNRLRKIIQTIHQAEVEDYDAAFDMLKEYLKQNNLIAESKPAPNHPRDIDLLKALFYYRNRLEPRGIIRTGINLNPRLLEAAARHYDENLHTFDQRNHPPYYWRGSKNRFCRNKIIGYAQLTLSDGDAYLLSQGADDLLMLGEQSTRRYTYFPNSTPDDLLGYHCVKGAIFELDSDQGSLKTGRSVYDFCRQKISYALSAAQAEQKEVAQGHWGQRRFKS